MNFGVEGTGTFVPRPAPKYDKTYTGVSSREVEPEYEPEFPIWLLTEDNTTPCLEGPPGCLLGTFTFQPPRIDLPAGTKVRNANFMWGGSLDIPMIVEPNWVFFDIKSPVRSYTTGGAREVYTRVGVEGFDDYTELVRTALLSGEQLPPTLVDVRYYPSEPRWWRVYPIYLGAVNHYYEDFSTLDPRIYHPMYLDVEYILPPVPEPSTGFLLILGAALMALRRKRTVH
jgi:hypothetical protein